MPAVAAPLPLNVIVTSEYVDVESVAVNVSALPFSATEDALDARDTVGAVSFSVTDTVFEFKVLEINTVLPIAPLPLTEAILKFTVDVSSYELLFVGT